MAQPYKVPNKSSAVDMLLSGIRGALSAGLTLEQQDSQKQQAAREWEIKVADLNLKKEQLDQQWNIALRDSKDKYDMMLANQNFEANQSVLANKAKEDLANTDIKRQILMKFMDLQIQETNKQEQRKWETSEKEKDRAVQREGHKLEAEKLGQSIAYQNATLGMTAKSNQMDWLFKAAGLENKPGVSLEEKQKDLDSLFNSALINYRNATKESAVEMYDALSAISVQRALNKFSIGGKGGWDSVIYTYDTNTGEPYTTDFAGYYTQQSKEVQDQILSSKNKTEQGKPLTQAFQEAATGNERTNIQVPVKTKLGTTESKQKVIPIFAKEPIDLQRSPNIDALLNRLSVKPEKEALLFLQQYKASIIKKYADEDVVDIIDYNIRLLQDTLKPKTGAKK